MLMMHGRGLRSWLRIALLGLLSQLMLMMRGLILPSWVRNVLLGQLTVCS